MLRILKSWTCTGASLLLVLASTDSHAQSTASEQVWTASVPPQVQDSQRWTQLLDVLIKKDLPFSALAASSRMLLFFQELPVKEYAYKTIIRMIDRGYPYPTYNLFFTGDITPSDHYDFLNSYNLYKAISFQQKGMGRWAENYFSQVDKENFPKYLFFQALEAYDKKDFAKSEELIKKILAKDLKDEKLPFIKKVARTLARIYFEEKKYDASLDVYNSFLLRLNPLITTDWLEAAWNLYHLKKYPEALGYLYNLERRGDASELMLEKYVIRALIYRDTCSLNHAEALSASFNRDFGTLIEGVKRGDPLQKFEALRRLKIPGNAAYDQLSSIVANLRAEQDEVKDLRGNIKDTANYFYKSELQMLQWQMKAYEDVALERAAERLLMLSEQLRFLRFGGAREKFNPDAVFKSDLNEDKPVFEHTDEGFQIHWIQRGDFWRDEALKLRGDIANRCSR